MRFDLFNKVNWLHIDVKSLTIYEEKEGSCFISNSSGNKCFTSSWRSIQQNTSGWLQNYSDNDHKSMYTT